MEKHTTASFSLKDLAYEVIADRRLADFDRLKCLAREAIAQSNLAAALPAIAPNRTQAEHDRAAERIAREIGGGA